MTCPSGLHMGNSVTDEAPAEVGNTPYGRVPSIPCEGQRETTKTANERLKKASVLVNCLSQIETVKTTRAMHPPKCARSSAG